jgi:NAD(P)-dependent dehydrogenase (short-subunit alcohol dehydrogenase family)
VRDRATVEQAVADSVASLGRLDFVIANTGVMPIYGADSESVSAWQMCPDVMLTGTLNGVETGYPYLVRQGEGGSIVLIGSMAALQPMIRTEGGHTLGMLGYGCVKAALINLARNYASFLPLPTQGNVPIHSGLGKV